MRNDTQGETESFFPQASRKQPMFEREEALPGGREILGHTGSKSPTASLGVPVLQ